VQSSPADILTPLTGSTAPATYTRPRAFDLPGQTLTVLTTAGSIHHDPSPRKPPDTAASIPFRLPSVDICVRIAISGHRIQSDNSMVSFATCSGTFLSFRLSLYVIVVVVCGIETGCRPESTLQRKETLHSLSFLTRWIFLAWDGVVHLVDTLAGAVTIDTSVNATVDEALWETRLGFPDLLRVNSCCRYKGVPLSWILGSGLEFPYLNCWVCRLRLPILEFRSMGGKVVTVPRVALNFYPEQALISKSNRCDRCDCVIDESQFCFSEYGVEFLLSWRLQGGCFSFKSTPLRSVT